MHRKPALAAAKTIALALCACAALAIGAMSASAAETHEYLGSIGAGELTQATSVAVAASGDVYVVDRGSGLVDRYAADGTSAPFLGSSESTIGPFQLPAESISQVAVDDSTSARGGDFYVIDGGTVRSYDEAGGAAPFADQSGYALGNLLTGTPGGAFSKVTGVAVDPNGFIYVTADDYVDIYSPQGEYVVQTNNPSMTGIAADSHGIAYAARPEYGQVTTLAPSVYPPEAGENYNVGYLFVVPTGLAVGPGDEVFVNDGTELHEYTSGSTPTPNEPVTTFGAEHLAGSKGVGVDPTSGDVYVAHGARVERFGPRVTVPNVVTEPATAVDSRADTATLNGTVEAEGGPVTGCSFEYGPTPALGETAPCVESLAEINSGTGAVPVHADVSGLEVANYSFRLVAADAQGSIAGATRAFSITGPPTVSSESAEAGSTQVRLAALVASGNQAATYHFEYGTTSDYGSSTPAGTLGASPEAKTITAGISGLLPQTTYHYRVVLGNTAGTVAGPDQTFVTAPPAGGGSCPNEALRTGESAFLPECRAYEQVTPADKAGGEVFPLYLPQAEESGEAIAYLSDAAFPGAQANNLLNTYVSSRSDANGGSWNTQAPDPIAYNEHGLLEASTVAYDRDFSKALQVSRLALAPGAVAGETNIYLYDLRTGSYVTIDSLPGSQFQSFTQLPYWYNGGTPDWSRIVLSTAVPLLPGAPGGVQAYEYSGGQLRLLELPGEEPANEGISYVDTTKDGNRTFFKASADPLASSAIYVNEGAGRTRLVSHAHRGGPAQEETPAFAEVKSFSNDGSVLYFTAPEGLLEGSEEDGLSTLYRWEAQGDRLQEVTPGLGASGAYTQVTAAVTNADGSYVYLAATASLTPNAPEPSPPASDLYVWHGGAGGGSLEYILETEEAMREETGPALAVSPDGRTVGMQSLSKLTGDVVRSPNCPADSAGTIPAGTCQNVFVYDYATKALHCASCTSTPTGSATLPSVAGPPLLSAREGRGVLDDGQVFFLTPSSLTSRDSNGISDLYEWSGGKSSLISTGTGEAPITYGGASGDGRNVFFETTQPLVAADDDTRYDVYDARVDGGIADQNAVRSEGGCSGEACRGASPAAPQVAAPQAPLERGSCGDLARRAKAIGHKASASAQKARKAPRRKAKQLRHRAAALRKQAKKLRTKTNVCRRQGR